MSAARTLTEADVEAIAKAVAAELKRRLSQPTREKRQTAARNLTVRYEPTWPRWQDYPTNDELDFAGFYVLIDDGRIVYVGESVHVHQRLKEHSLLARRWTHARVLQFEENLDRALAARRRRLVESALIEALGLECYGVGNVRPGFDMERLRSFSAREHVNRDEVLGLAPMRGLIAFLRWALP